MSTTLLVALRGEDLLTNQHLQDHIQSLGYDFAFQRGLEKQMGSDGVECSINGHPTFIETYVGGLATLLEDPAAAWIQQGLGNKDTALCFSTGADYAAGACIGLITIALIDHCDALAFYLDDQLPYTREMLLAETPQFLKRLEQVTQRRAIRQQPVPATPPVVPPATPHCVTWWDRLWKWFT